MLILESFFLTCNKFLDCFNSIISSLLACCLCTQLESRDCKKIQLLVFVKRNAKVKAGLL
jgi:hypothetical protein